MATNNHPAKDKAHKLRPSQGTASKHPASEGNVPRKPDTAADGIQPGSHIDRQATKNWEHRDDPSRDKS